MLPLYQYCVSMFDAISQLDYYTCPGLFIELHRWYDVCWKGKYYD